MHCHIAAIVITLPLIRLFSAASHWPVEFAIDAAAISLILPLRHAVAAAFRLATLLILPLIIILRLFTPLFRFHWYFHYFNNTHWYYAITFRHYYYYWLLIFSLAITDYITSPPLLLIAAATLFSLIFRAAAGYATYGCHCHYVYWYHTLRHYVFADAFAATPFSPLRYAFATHY